MHEKEGTCSAEVQQLGWVMTLCMPGRKWLAYSAFLRVQLLCTGQWIVTTDAVTDSLGGVWAPVKSLVYMLTHSAVQCWKNPPKSLVDRARYGHQHTSKGILTDAQSSAVFHTKDMNGRVEPSQDSSGQTTDDVQSGLESLHPEPRALSSCPGCHRWLGQEVCGYAWTSWHCLAASTHSLAGYICVSNAIMHAFVIHLSVSPLPAEQHSVPPSEHDHIMGQHIYSIMKQTASLTDGTCEHSCFADSSSA